MKMQFGRILVGVGAVTLLATPFTQSAASATSSSSVSFQDATFSGYASGTEAHLAALQVGTTRLANVDEGLSGATTNTAGLTAVNKDPETSVIVQPAQSSTTKAYGTGSGLEVGLATSSAGSTDPNQILLAGKVQSTAPPTAAALTKQIGPIDIPSAASPVILHAQALLGRSAAIFDPAGTQCPIGQPISYGLGYAANVNALTLVKSPTLNTAGTGTATAQSQSDTFLSPNADSTFGLASAASETVAPVTVNILNLFTIRVTVAGKNPNTPISLLSKAGGEPGTASVNLLNAGLVSVTLQVAGGTPMNIETVDLSNPSTLGPNGFLHIDINTGGSALHNDLVNLSDAIAAVLNGNSVTPPLASLFATGGPLNGLLGTAGTTATTILSKLATIDLGGLDIDARPHAIGGSDSSHAVTSADGTSASGAIDLVHLHILPLTGSAFGFQLPAAISSITAADLYAGHLEAAANNTNAIRCSIPIIKTSTPTSVTAGQSFTYNIQVPDPAKVNLIDCNLDNIKVIDTINDFSGTPSFKVSSANDGGVINQTSDNSATVTWTGLSWKVGQPPLDLAITVSTPTDSAKGIIQDLVVASGVAGQCTGGVSGQTGVGTVGGSTGVTLTGSFTLQQPGVSNGPASGNGASGTTLPSKLPFTGAMGGVWQPIAGVTVLGLGGGALALARRARRRQRA